MDEKRRLISRVQEMPSSQFTEWERGVIYGLANYSDSSLWGRFRDALEKWEVRIGARKAA